MINNINTICFDMNGLKICLGSNNDSYLASAQSYLSMSKTAGEATAPDILHQINIVEHNEADLLMPLPGRDYFVYQSTLLLEQPVRCFSYQKGSSRWTDYTGLGRTMVDRATNKTSSIIYKNHHTAGVYLDILFCYNPILSSLNRLGYEVVHAACAVIEGKGILFTGKSGQGKSTAAGALLCNGYPLLADDRVLIKKEEESYTAYSISDVVKLGAPSLKRFFPELQALPPLHRVDDNYYYKISRISNMHHLETSKVDALCVFSRIDQPTSRIEPIAPAQVVGDLFPVTLGVREPEATTDKFNFLIDMLAKLNCYKIYFGTDMKSFTAAIQKLAYKV